MIKRETAKRLAQAGLHTASICTYYKPIGFDDPRHYIIISVNTTADIQINKYYQHVTGVYCIKRVFFFFFITYARKRHLLILYFTKHRRRWVSTYILNSVPSPTVNIRQPLFFFIFAKSSYYTFV